MRRPGGEKTYELFSEAAGHGDISIRPSRSAKTKRGAPFSIRLSQDERERLTKAAGSMPLGTYIKARLFADLPAVPRQRAHSGVDRAMIGQALASLGQSRLSANMNQIAKAANRGALPFTSELIDDLNAACGNIQTMRQVLVSALGVKSKR